MLKLIIFNMMTSYFQQAAADGRTHMEPTEMKLMTACTMDCPDTCSLIIEKSGTGHIAIKGNPDHPVTAGFTCAKIKKHPQRLTSPHRITTPMVRTNGHWRNISWDAALDLCAENINALRSEPESILHCHGEGAKGVLKQLNKHFFAQLGATRTKGSLCDAAGFIAGLTDFGSRQNNDIADVLNTNHIVNWGKDFAKSSVHTARLIQKAVKQGAGLLTITPFAEFGSDKNEDIIKIKPGTDRFLAAAAIKRLIEKGGISSQIISRTRHWDTLKRIIAGCSLEDLCMACEVSERDVEKLTDRYTSMGPVATFIGAGLQRYAYGGENVRFINALVLLSGNVGHAGGGVYFHLHSLANLNNDWTIPDGKKSRRALPIAAIGKSILEAENPQIKMIWVNGSNVLNQAPDSAATIQAFKKVPFKVVVDAFMTDTARQADLFLPAALMLEQEDIVGSYLHHYVHFVDKVIDPPGQAKSDDWILYELARRLDPPVSLPNRNDCFIKSLATPELNISLAALKKEKFVKAARPQVVYQNLKFHHADGRFRFPITLHPETPPPAGYPLRLLSLIRNNAMHSQILPESHDVPLEVWLSPDCPEIKKLDLNKNLWLVSPIGRLKVRIKMAANLHSKTVVARRGTWMAHGGGLNQLIEATITDIGKGAAFYAQYVRIEN